MSKTFQFTGTDGTPLLYINPSGYVGFGTTTPTTKLDIKGDIKSTGNIVLAGGSITVAGVSVINASGILSTSAMPPSFNTGSMNVGTITSADITASNVTVAGNLTVSGTTTSLNTETVNIRDNMILVNSTQTGNPSSLMVGGIEVERGNLPNYQFVFQESSQLFKVGLSNNLQAVATRPDVITDGAVGYWNTSNTQMAFSSTLASINASGLSTTRLTTSGIVYTSSMLVSGLNVQYLNGLESTMFVSSSANQITTLQVNTSGITARQIIADSISSSTSISSLTVNTSGIAAYQINVSGNINFTGTLMQNGVPFSSGISSTNLTVDTSDAININTNSNVSVLTNTNSTTVTSFGQPTWAGIVDGTSSDVGNGVCTDPSGNVYMIGNYGSTSSAATVWNGSGVSAFSLRNPSASPGAFIVKYTPTGTPLWGASISGTYGENGNGVCTDSQGNVYVTGYFVTSGGAVAVYNASGTQSFTLNIPNTGSSAAFLIKYSAFGIPLWGAAIDGTDSGSGDVGYGVAVDSQGNVYMTGNYGSSSASGTVFNGSLTAAFTLRTPSNSASAFIVKYNGLGAPLWGATVDGIGYEVSFGVCTDSFNNVYLSGIYGNGNPQVFNSSNTSQFSLRTSNGGLSAFLIKYNGSGTPLWAGSIDGTSNDYGRGVSTDSFGNVYVTGEYGDYTYAGSTVYNGSGISTFTLRNTSGESAAYLVKYNGSGTPLWAGSIDGPSADVGQGVSTDKQGNVYIVGHYDSAPMGAGVYNGSGVMIMALRPVNSKSAFLVKYNSSGNPLWAGSIDGINQVEQGLGVVADVSGNVYITGMQSGSASVYNGSGVQVFTLPTSSGGWSAFLVKYMADGDVVTVSPYSLPSSLTPSSNGFQKILYNKAVSTAVVNIRNSTDTATLSTLTIGAGTNQKLVWVNNEWLVL